jgi:hypothetical protein
VRNPSQFPAALVTAPAPQAIPPLRLAGQYRRRAAYRSLTSLLSRLYSCWRVAGEAPRTLYSGEAAAARQTPPAVTTNGLYTSAIGSSYEGRLSAKGGPPPYAWSIAAGQIPPGLTLDTASGKTMGTPTQAGRFVLTYSGCAVSDEAGRRSTSSCFRRHRSARPLREAMRQQLAGEGCNGAALGPL